MSLLYRTLRSVLRLGVELYFVEIQAAGRANIPAQGPLIFAANHPNSIMDTVILGTQTNRRIAYLARSGLFRNPLVALLFNHCGVIPIYRNPSDAPGANEESFHRAFEVLEEGGSIGIFPEGRNSEERQVLEIKTGTARIALGAEARNDFRLGVKIVPVGLNFENRDQFMSRVLVRFGAPIEASSYASRHRSDPRAAVRELTDAIQAGIREAATHIDDFRVVDLVHDIDAIYGRELLESILADREAEKRSYSATFDELLDEGFDDSAIVDDILSVQSGEGLTRRLLKEVKSVGPDTEDLDERFWVMERIAKAVRYFEAAEPETFRDMRIRVWRYQDHLKQVRLRSDFAERPPETLSFRKEGAKLTLYTLIFALPAIWGFVHNALPYVLTGLVTMRAPDEAMRAFTGLLSGALIYGLWYAAILFGVFTASADPFFTAVYGASMPVAGYFFLRYRIKIARYRDRILARTLFQTERQLIRGLQLERKQLIEDFDTLRERFLEAEEKGLI